MAAVAACSGSCDSVWAIVAQTLTTPGSEHQVWLTPPVVETRNIEPSCRDLRLPGSRQNEVHAQLLEPPQNAKAMPLAGTIKEGSPT